MPEPITPTGRQPARRAATRRSARWGRRRLRRAQFGWPLAIALGSTLAGPAFAQNLPQGGTVVGGSGTIQQIDPNLLQIQQNSQNLAIDWQSFNVGPSGIVRFLQPSASAIALNRVIGNDPSAIYGQIQANGQVILLNPKGIYFGPNSMVDVNAMVATTANIRNDDFMAGRLLFGEASGDANARVVNEGLVSVAQGGFAVLAAASVQNTGRIVANGGTVVLAGTKTFTVDFHGDGLLSFAATGIVDQAPAGASALVDNSGIIEAAGGRVLMTARAARNVLDNVINTTGIVVAHSAQMVNGEIVIDGGDNGIVSVNGLVDASGRGAGETGGTIKVLGEKVGLFQNARLDVSGDAGGGTALVGGNYQGKGPEANAKMVYMDAAAVIDASAITSGDGGRVILWSDEATRNAGHINVSGANDGGFVEVSSKGFLDFRGTVDLAGRAGRAGSLLLDPTDITITSGASSGDMSGSSPFAGTNASSNLDVAVLNAALTGGTVTVTTASAGGGTGNIDITASIVNGSAGTNLILRADGNITIGAGGFLNAAGNAMNVSLRAGGNITVGGIGISLSGGTLTTTGVGGTGNAGGNFSNTALITTSAGAITLNQAGSVTFNANVSTTSTLTINADGTVTQPGGFFTGPLNLAIGGTGTVNLNDLSNSISNLTLNRTGTSNNVTIATSVSPNMQTSTLGTGIFTLDSSAGFLQSGAITQDGGGGAVAINGGTGSVTLSQANTFTGALTVTSDSISATAAQTVADVTLRPSTGGTNITFNNGGGGLALSAATIGNFAGATDLTIGSTSAGTLTVAAAYSAPSGQNLSLISGGTMTVGNTLTTSGTGTLSLISAKNVVVTSNLTTAGGDMLLEGNVTSWTSPFTNTVPTFSSTAGNFIGVSITGVTLSAGGGDIAIAGKGGTTGINQFGIYIGPSTALATTGAGTINLVGLAGPSTSDTPGSGGSHTGLYFNGGASGTFVDISTVNGNIALTGTGAGSGGATDNNAGVSLIFTKVRSTGTGGIDITGTGGVGGSRGVVIALAPSEVSTVSGDITIFGTGGSGYNATGYGFASQGVDLAGGVVKTTGAGDISIRAIAGPSSSAFSTSSTNIIGDTLMTGDLTIRADSYTIGGTLSITHQNATGTVEFRPDTDATTIGAAGGTGVAQIPTALLASVTNFGTLKIGSATQSGAINVGMWTPTVNTYLQTSGAISTDALTMATNTLTIDNGGAYTQVGGITGTGLVTFLGSGAVTATDPGNSFTNVAITKTGSSAVSLTTTGALNFATSSLGSGALTVTSAGVTQSGAITTSGAAFFNAGANAITLGSINALSGTVRFFNSGANNVNFMNGATNFGGGTTTVGGNLVVNAAGNLTQASALSVAGNATFSAGANTITLTNASNAVTGDVAFTNAADTVSWREAAAVSLAASSSAALSVQAGGAITQTGTLTVTGAASFTAGANAITLTDGSNAFAGAVTLVNTGANNVQLTNAGAIDLNGSSVGGNLTLIKTGAGDITQSSPLTVGGTLSADAGSGLITLNQGANSITGAVSLSSTNVGTNQIQNGGPLVIGTINLTGNLDAIGNSGAITQSGVIAIGGDATFTTGGYAITLANASNAVGGNVSLNNTGANAVSWQESGAVSLAASGVGGNLTVQSGGAITQAGALTVGGNASFTTGAFAITLTHASNAVAGDASFNNTGANAVSWNEAAAVSLGASNIGGDHTVTAGGAITQTGGLTVGGNASFTTGAFAITLNNAANAVTGYVTLSNSGANAVAWQESGAVSLAASGVGGDLTVQSGGAITQIGALTVTGAASFNAGANAITLTDGSNAFAGAVTLVNTGANNVQLTNAGTIDLNGSSVGGNLTLVKTGAGDITQSSPLTVGGTTTLTMNSGNLTLNQGANSFGGAVSITKTGTGTVTLQNGAPLDLGTSNVAGDLVLTANSGGISQSGVLTLGGDLTMTAAGTLDLTQINSYAAGKNVSLTATGASGTISVTADQILTNGNFTAVGSAGVAVTAGIDTGGGNVTIWGNSPGGVANGVTAGSFFGVNIDGAGAHIDAGGGNISIVGAGGSANYMHGVSIRNAAYVETSGSGTITVTGRGGSGAGGASFGVEFYAGGSYAQTQNGALAITGTGGAGGGDGNTGVAMATGEIRATGTGTVTVTGTGGAGGSAGINLSGGGPTVISAVNGNMSLNGTGGSGDDLSGIFGGLHSWGINLANNADVKTTGSGNLSVTANGGTDGVSDYRIGMVMQQTALLRTTGTGAINVVANGGTGSGGNNHGFYIQDSGSAVSTTGGGNITLSGTAGAGGTTSGGIILSSSGTIVTTGGGNISLTGSASTNDGIFDVSGGPINSSGTLLLSSNNGINLGSSNVIATGNLTVSSTFNNVTLSGIGNAFANGGSELVLTASGGGDATIHNSTATKLGATNISGAFSLISDGALTQSVGAALNVGTNADIDVTSGALTLTNSTNNIAGSVALTTAAGNASYVGAGNVLLGMSDVTGNLSVTASGNVGQVGSITVSGTTTVSAGANQIDLNDPTNDFAGAVTLSNSGSNNVTLTTTGNLVLASVNVGSGTLTLTAGGGGPGTITQSGTIVQQAGAAGVSLGSDGAITLGGSNVFTGPITVVGANGGNVTLNNTGATIIGGASTVGVYTLTSGGAISQTGSVSTGDLNLTAAGNITMTDAFNNAGDVYLTTTAGGNATYNEIGYTSLKSVNVAGNLSVTVDTGDLAQTGVSPYTVGGTTNLTTLTSGYISLTQANSFGGAVTLTAAGAVDITAAQTVASGGFTANAGGAISVNSGGGITTSGGAINLNTTANIAFSTAFLTSNGGDIDLTAGPGGPTSAEFLFTNINAGGGDIAITGQGATSGNGQHGIWIGSSSTVQTNGAGEINLTGTGGASSGSGNVGVFVYGGTVQTATGDITVNATGGGTSGSSGSNHGLAMQLGGHITSTSGDINITGTASTSGGSGNSNYGVTLDGSGTLIQTGGIGFVTINGTGGTATGGSNTGIQIATGSTVAVSAGNLTATGIGGGGNSTGVLFNGGGGTGGLVSSGSGAVVINGTGGGSDVGIAAIGSNSILGGGSATGAVQFGADSLALGSSVTIQTTNQVRFNTQTAGLSLGINNSGSAFNLTSATIANVSPTASLIVLGDVAATGTITVGTDAANTFTTGIALRNSGGANPINIVGALSTAGDLDVSAGGAVTQTGALTVGGTSYFNSGGNVTLTNAANAMSGDIGFSVMSGNIALANSGATSFSNSFTTGTLSVSVTGGTVSQTGALNVTGAATVTSDSAIAWNNASNAFGGPLNITTTAGANATVYNSLATTLNTVSVAGNLDVASASTLGQGGSPLTVGGTSHFSSVGATTLADPSNSFGGAVSLMTTSGGNATIAATGQLILGTSTIAGNFNASVGSPMTQTGALAVTGTSDFTATSGPLTLTNASNTFGGAVTLTNTGNFAVGIAASGALTLGNVTMTGGSTGGFTATASNGIAQSGGTTIQAGAGPTVLAGGAGTVVLGETGNSFGSTVSLSGTGGSLAGFVNGQTGAAAAPFVTATGGLFDVNGTTVGSAPTTTATGTQAVLNEIASVAPIDSATRAVDSPLANNGGVGSPAIDSTLGASSGDLTGGTGTGEEPTTTNVAGGSTQPTGQPGTGTPTGPTGPTAGSGTPAPTIVLSDGSSSGGSAPTDVRAEPGQPLGPTTLIQGVLVNNPLPSGSQTGGTSGITNSYPQQGNSTNWGPAP